MTLTTGTEHDRGAAPAPAPEPSASPGSRRRGALGWGAVALVFAAAVVLAVVVVRTEGSSSAPDVVPVTARRFPQGLPGSADAADRWLSDRAGSPWPQGSPGSADAAERWAAARQQRIEDAACRQRSRGIAPC